MQAACGHVAPMGFGGAMLTELRNGHFDVGTLELRHRHYGVGTLEFGAGIMVLE